MILRLGLRLWVSCETFGVTAPPSITDGVALTPKVQLTQIEPMKPTQTREDFSVRPETHLPNHYLCIKQNLHWRGLLEQTVRGIEKRG